MIAIAPRVEMDFGSGWEDVSEDVVSNVKAEWGIHSGAPLDRVAETGSLAFELDNSVCNSAGVRGYYSPGHGDARTGFGLGAPVRLVLHHATFGDRVKWVGTVSSIRPLPGAPKPSTAVQCVDWMDEAARAKLSGLAVSTDIQSDQVFLLLAAAVERQPPGGLRYGAGSDLYPIALDNVQDENARIMSELQKLALSEYGIVYVAAGTLVFEGRRVRTSGASVRFALHEDVEITAMGVSHARDDVANRVQVSVHPRRVDADATTVLFSLGSAVLISRYTSLTINCAYRDPNQQARRVAGVEMAAPVATTDYRFTAAKDGSGANLTAALAVTAVFGGNSATVTLANNGPADGYVPVDGLRLRGRGLYDYEPLISDQVDQTSIDDYGENNLAYDMPYQSSTENAFDMAMFLLSKMKDPSTQVTSVTFVANWSDSVAEQAFGLEISDRVSITSPTEGLVAQPFYVNGFRLDVRMNGVAIVTMDLAPCDTSRYWLLGVDGRTELDETTMLGYGLFVPGWILDASEVGVGTFLS